MGRLDTEYVVGSGGRRIFSWLASGAAALGMTIILFCVIPGLLHLETPSPRSSPPAAQINVIRMRRPDIPVTRNSPPPPPATPKKPKLLPDAAPLQMPQTNLNLPFEINPKLSGGPATLAMPPMASIDHGNFRLPDVFNVSDLDRPLITLSRIPPVYPMQAKRMGVEGWVKVRFVVTDRGTVERVTIVDACPPEVFDRSVTQCVSGWRFKPGTVEGMPVNTWAETTVTFHLKS
ncbi:putative TonB family protein [Desulfosarcina variabilis str. Montpellier]|uniref:energy transducer TonB n=1 Tax=Desulfosarcina variabilis TaxID=2300 RepID=UPI003AFB1FE2